MAQTITTEIDEGDVVRVINSTFTGEVQDTQIVHLIEIDATGQHLWYFDRDVEFDVEFEGYR